MAVTFLDRLQSGEILVTDGAINTNLHQRGLARGMPSEHWVLENPEQIVRLHQDFIQAGCDLICTATFAATSIRLANVGLEARAAEINRRAANLARQAAGTGGTLVAGTIGPTGHLLKPLGPLEEEEAIAAFAAQAQVLSAAGVDLLIIGTQFDLSEAKAAIQGVRSVTNLDLVVSFSYDRGTRTMMGIRPATMASELADLGVDVLGINCGRSLEDNLNALIELRSATRLPIFFRPNVSLPVLDEDANPIYSTTPEKMGALAPEWVAAGAQIVGGCCGTAPAHVAAIAQAVKGRC